MTFKEIEYYIYNYSTNWVINYYENLINNKKQEFLELLTNLLEYIDNKELFFYNLKFYLKGLKDIKDIEYQLLLDATMPYDSTPLSYYGYTILSKKYDEQLAKDLYEMFSYEQNNINEETSESMEEFMCELI